MLKGPRIDVYLDNFLTTLAYMGPRSLKLFNNKFDGQSACIMQQIHLHTGMHLEDSPHYFNFDLISVILENLEYACPVAAGTKKTVYVKSIQHYNRVLVGSHGG